jgi:hypothetical protein
MACIYNLIIIRDTPMPCRPLLSALFLATGLLSANDGAAAIGAGGQQLRREPRVVMAREKLFISTRLIRWIMIF